MRPQGTTMRMIRPCLIVSALLAFAAPPLLLLYDLVADTGADGWLIGWLIVLSLGLAFAFAVLAGMIALISVMRRGG